MSEPVWVHLKNHEQHAASFKNVANSHIYSESPRARRVLPQLATPARLLPRDVRDELRSKFGCHRPNIERMVYDEFWGC